LRWFGVQAVGLEPQTFAAITAPGTPAWLREIPAVELLRQVWIQNFCLIDDAPTAGSKAGALGKAVHPVQLRIKQGGLPPSSLMAASPRDPEVHSATKRPDSLHRFRCVPPHQPTEISSRVSLSANSETRMGENGSRGAGLRARFDRHENGAPRAFHGVEQNKNHDFLLNLGAEPSGSTLLMNESGQFGPAV
jgi:hypothetical protein